MSLTWIFFSSYFSFNLMKLWWQCEGKC
jgi:hypothetical protein